MKPLSGRFFGIVAVIKSYPGHFLGFSEFIIDLISFFENFFNGLFIGFGAKILKDGLQKFGPVVV